MRYYLHAVNGRRYGPADLETLRLWVQEKRLLPDSELEEEHTGRRLAAGMVEGLFDATPVDGANAEALVTFQEPRADVAYEAPRFRWNWAAFSLYPLWLAVMQRWDLVGLSVVVLLLSKLTFGLLPLVWSIYMGARGERLVWERQTHWPSFEAFRKEQDRWVAIGVIASAFYLLVWTVIILFWMTLGGFLAGLMRSFAP